MARDTTENCAFTVRAIRKTRYYMEWQFTFTLDILGYHYRGEEILPPFFSRLEQEILPKIRERYPGVQHFIGPVDSGIVYESAIDRVPIKDGLYMLQLLAQEEIFQV